MWEHAGIICTGETYKAAVKLTFAKGASLKDPSGLFNASLEGNVRRAIDFHEGDKIDEKALKALILAAVALNASTARRSGADSINGMPNVCAWGTADRARFWPPMARPRMNRRRR